MGGRTGDWVANRLTNRRWQLAVCVVAMDGRSRVRSTPGTLFTEPLARGLGAQLSHVQVAFTLFILAQSWLVPVLGYVMDLLGARVVVALGGILVGLSWVGSGLANSVWELYLFYAMGGRGRRGGLRCVHRAGPEMVSGSSRSGGGPGGRRLRLGGRADRGPDPPPDRGGGVSDRVHDLGAPSGRSDRPCRLAHDDASPGLGARPSRSRRPLDTSPHAANLAWRASLPFKWFGVAPSISCIWWRCW